MYRKFARLVIKEYGGLPLLASTSALAVVISLLEAFNVGLLVPFLETLASEDQGSGHWISRLFADVFEALGIPFKLGPILLVLAAVVFLIVGLKYLRMVLLSRAKEGFTAWLRSRYMRTLLNADMSYFHTEKLGVLSDCLTNQARNGGGALIAAGEVITLMPMIATYVVAAFLVAPDLTAIAVAIIVVVALGAQYFVAKARTFGAVGTYRENQLQAAGVETLSGIHVIKSFLQERTRWKSFTDEAERTAEIVYQRERSLNQMALFQEGTLFVLIGILVYVGVSLLKLDVAVIVAILFIFFRLAPRVSSLNASRHGVAIQLAALERVDEVFEEANKPKIVSGETPFVKLEKSIQLSNVSFSYDGSGEVLRAANITIEKGKTIAIVGSSGAGKTTLVDLILRHYDPDSGQILVDGVDLRELDLVSWRSSIGLVSQDVFLFNDTVANNISLGRAEVTEERILAAARRAYAHDFIQELPWGYETTIGDRGWNLSGGQRQRLALARAIVTDPEILILDEATSSLDSESEQLIQNYMREVHGTCTMVVIAHRTASLRDADRIVVLRDGSVAEEGDWDTLMEEAGVFATYHQLQSGAPPKAPSSSSA